jgi:hypothetical protein
MIKILASLLFLLGIFLVVTYAMVAEAIKNESLSESAAKANQGLFAMGILFIVSPMALLVCDSNCECAGLKNNATMYLGFFMALGIVLLSLASTLINSGVGTAKGYVVTVLVLGIVLILACAGGLYVEHKDKLMGSSSKLENKFKFF